MAIDIDKAKQRLQRRSEERYQRRESLRTHLLHRVVTLVPQYLETFPEVSKIILFGSIVRPGYFNEISDVDIALESLPNASYWQALIWWCNQLEFEHVDLVQVEMARPSVLKYIEKGTVIYEKDSGRAQNLKG